MLVWDYLVIINLDTVSISVMISVEFGWRRNSSIDVVFLVHMSEEDDRYEIPVMC